VTATSSLSHLAPHEISALADFVQRLRLAWPDQIVHVWLFGSKARGDSGPESDMDVLIVAVNGGWGFEKSLTRIALEIDLIYGVVLTDHVVDTARFQQMAARQEPLYHSVQREGIDLWSMELQPTT
jgi:predicted nucleotidyltransferase